MSTEGYCFSGSGSTEKCQIDRACSQDHEPRHCHHKDDFYHVAALSLSTLPLIKLVSIAVNVLVLCVVLWVVCCPWLWCFFIFHGFGARIKRRVALGEVNGSWGDQDGLTLGLVPQKIPHSKLSTFMGFPLAFGSSSSKNIR